jgi:hypothetical protein
MMLLVMAVKMMDVGVGGGERSCFVALSSQYPESTTSRNKFIDESLVKERLK